MNSWFRISKCLIQFHVPSLSFAIRVFDGYNVLGITVKTSVLIVLFDSDFISFHSTWSVCLLLCIYYSLWLCVNEISFCTTLTFFLALLVLWMKRIYKCLRKEQQQQPLHITNTFMQSKRIPNIIPLPVNFLAFWIFYWNLNSSCFEYGSFDDDVILFGKSRVNLLLLDLFCYYRKEMRRNLNRNCYWFKSQ